jgi:hypothetical protein
VRATHEADDRSQHGHRSEREHGPTCAAIHRLWIGVLRRALHRSN